MKYRNNLTDVSNNTYFEVVEPFEVYVPVAKYLANTFYGSSQLYGVQYKKITLQVADQLHDTVGGVFVSFQGKLVPARMNLSEKHPFEKVYGMQEENYPIASLKEISGTQKISNTEYFRDFPTIPAPSHYFGRSVDSLLED